MRHISWVVLLLVAGLAAGPAKAQFLGPGWWKTAAPASYVGPADAATVSAAIWYSCAFAASAAYATSNGNACQIERTSDSTTCTYKFASSGAADLTVGTPCPGTETVMAWLTRGTFSGAISSGAMTTTGDSCTAATNDQVLGAGITKPTFITGVTSCSAGSGVYTVTNNSFSISAETMTDIIASKVAKAFSHYPGICGPSNNAVCDVVQTTVADQPIFVLNAIGAAPCMFGSALQWLENATGSFGSPIHQPFVLSSFVEQISGAPIFGNMIDSQNSVFDFGASANDVRIFANSAAVSASQTDGQFHAIAGVFNDAGSGSSLTVDANTPSTGSIGTADFTNTDIAIMSQAGGGGTRPMDGYLCETGLFISPSVNVTALNANENTRY